MNTLSLQLFGGFTLRRNGQPLPATRTRKEQWLLALLVLRSPQPLERAWLAATLWPDSSDLQARSLLRHSLSNLRAVLGPDAFRLVSETSRTLCFDVSGMQVDVLAFDATLASQEAAELERVIGLYGGPLLAGCEEGWALSERHIREQGYCQALETLAQQAQQSGDTTKAVSLLRRLLVVDPLKESAVRRLMQMLAQQGDQAAITQVYQQFRLLLHDQMHIQPDAETSALYRLLQAEKRENAQALALGLAPLRRLPVPATPLIGREQEIEQILALRKQTRLLTLAGSGGVGKTRLSIAAAEAMADEYAGGVCFVDLVPLQEPARVIETVATALDVREEPDRPLLETLLDCLQARSLLLILDNCEHLLEACASLVEALLARCPHLRLLATSRQPLGVAGEQTWRVPSLTLPEGSEQAWEQEKEAQAILMSSEAVQLFVERAVSTQPSFRLTRENVGSVAELCRLLEGIPLAIELAAGWVRMLPVGQVVARLRERLDLLQSRQPGRFGRQQTLRATLDWSYDLLTEPEQRLLARLSVFVGGWTLEAAEAVCVEEGEAPDSVLLGLAGLVDKSLVVYEEKKGVGRYRFLETTRQYAQEHLSEPERERVLRRHAGYFLDQAQAIQEEYNQNFFVRRAPYRRDRENYRAAWRRWEQVDANKGIAMMLALSRCDLTFITPYAEVECSWIERLATSARPAPSPLQADLYYVVGRWAWLRVDPRWRSLIASASALAEGCQDRFSQAIVYCLLGEHETAMQNYSSAQSHFEAARDLFQRNGNQVRVVLTQIDLAEIAYKRGDMAEAQNLAEGALRSGREFGSMSAPFYALATLGDIAFQEQDYSLARRYREDSLQYCSREEAPDYTNTLRTLGNIATRQGDFEAARAYILESISVAQEIEDPTAMGWGYVNLAWVARWQGDYALATEYAHRALQLFHSHSDSHGVLYNLRYLANLAREQGQTERAAILLAFYDATARQNNWRHLPEHRRLLDSEIEALKAEMAAEAFASAWSQGSAMTLEAAVEYALQGQMDL